MRKIQMEMSDGLYENIKRFRAVVIQDSTDLAECILKGKLLEESDINSVRGKRGVKCGCCGTFIAENQEYFCEKTTCGIYCSLLCCAKERLNYDIRILNDDEVDDHCVEWEEDD